MLNDKREIPAQVHARLKVFLVCAKLLSFTQAAQALHVTVGAVSQQIKQLEEWLGFRLFVRLPRRLTLTDEGARLKAAVGPAYEAVDLEIGRLSGGNLAGIVKVRALPSFMAKWLVPRLPDFQRRYPALALQLEAEDSSQALQPGAFDLAIDLNDGVYSGFDITPLMEEEIFPVCAPALLDASHPISTPDDLRHYPLLHDMTAWRGSPPYAEWEGYLRAIGAPQVEVRRGYMFNRNHLTIEAAIAGMGVAIARRTLTTDELARGRLVAPFAQRVSTGKRYGIAYAPGALDDRRVAAVHDWLVEAAARAEAG
ncbi:LysR substrate-binding domain-containing protein [Orrella dioscoreae]|uniref:LysR substrate-binding domain-containing protein n=1 Tax=Orrella dioscoreae TaxID=1851544 RepID=UPI00082B39DE|nr:LysR substrate-binding domain-containing protein [Orrella dioscoreae]